MMNLKYISLQKMKYLVWLCVIVWAVMVWPVGVFRLNDTSKSFPDDNLQTDAVTEELPVIQEFTPQYDRLRTVAFVFNKKGGAVDAGTVLLRIYDADIRLLAEQEFDMEEISDGGYTEAEVDLNVEPGALYYMRIEVKETGQEAPTLSYRSLAGCGPEENGTLYYGTTVIEDGSAVCRYEYGKPLGPAQILAYDSFGIFLGTAAVTALSGLQKKREE